MIHIDFLILSSIFYGWFQFWYDQMWCLKLLHQRFSICFSFFIVSRKQKETYAKRFIVGKEVPFWSENVFLHLKRRCYNTDSWTFFRFQWCLVVLTNPAMCFLIRWTLYFDATPYCTVYTAGNTIKEGQKMPDYDVHAKPLQKRPNFWNLALTMRTWQPWKKTAPPAPTPLHQSKMSHTELLLSFPVFDSIALARLFIVCNVEINTPWMLELCCCSSAKNCFSDCFSIWNFSKCCCSDRFMNFNMLSTPLSVWYGAAKARLLAARLDMPVNKVVGYGLMH